MKAKLLSILLPFLALSPSVPAAAADGDTSDYREAYKRVVPPSPTVSSLCKYGEYPVGNSTGTPDITIPLYTISCGDLELPITLSYHAGGIKVDETASWVGLGWSLSAGGSIGVTVNGERDARSWPAGMPSYEDLHTGRAFFDSGMVSKWTIMAWQDMYTRQADGDANPDIYNYNICGRSGQFVHDLNDGNFYEIGGDKNFSFANIGEIPMYAFDRKGNRYDFLAYEDLSSFFSNSKGTEERTYISANNLTCVRSHNGVDTIGLSYTRDWEMVRYKTANPLFYGRDAKDNSWTYQSRGITSSVAPSFLVEGHTTPTSSVALNYRTQKPLEIRASNGMRVVFTHSRDRKDTRGDSPDETGRSLSAITVYNGDGDRVRQWQFKYGYFVSPVVGDDSTAAYRLKLTGLLELGADDGDTLRYHFSYYGEEEGEPQMPYRHSFAGHDLWGYCNGLPSAAEAANPRKAFANFRSPFFYRKHLSYYNTEQHLHLITDYDEDAWVNFKDGDDKSCDAGHLSAYSLKEIHYPTGGYTRFVYEPNNFCCIDNYNGDVAAFCMDGNGQRIKRIENFDGLATTKTEYTYSEGWALEMPHFASRELYQSWNLEVASEGQSGSAVHDEVYNNAIRIYNEEIRTYLKLSPSPINQLGIAGSDNVSYGEVRETRGDGSFTVSRYSELTERSYNARGFAGYMRDTYCTYYGALDSYYWASGLGLYNNANVSDSRLSAKNGRWGTFFSRGQIVRKTAFDASGRMMLDEKYNYETPYESLHNVVGLDVIQSRVPEVYLKMNDVYDAHVWPVFYANFHYITTGFSRLATKSVTEWRKTPTTASTSNKAYTGMVTYTTYRYDPDNLITAEETDYLCTEADSLVYDNSVPTVTDDEDEDGEEEADTIQEQEAQTAQHILSHGVYTTYPHNVNKGVYAGMATARMLDYPVERREAIGGSTVSAKLITYNFQGRSYCPDGIYTYTPNTPDGSWTGFNGTTVPSNYGEPDLRIGYTSGRIASLTDKAGTVKTYEWDNRLQYPINETTTGPLGDGAHTRLFSYKAGVGMTGETKENGYRLSYAYDAMCRLASVYDSTGLLASHSYHFSNKDIGGEGRENSFVDTWTWIDADAGKAIVERQFHDGLGYPTLKSVLGINTTGRAVSTLTEYDECRRTAKVWLPAVGGTAMESMSQSEYATIARETYSSGEDGDLLYGRYKYDGLGRTTNAYMAGEPWANKCKLTRRLANGPDEVKVYGADATTLTANGASFYPPGALQADDERDEDGHRLRVYKDCLGRKVLERRVVVEATSRREGEFNDTYFVYSPTGQLRYVLQPMYQEGGDLRKYAFQYFYDGQGRLSAKVLPGCGRIAYTYDDADRIVAMQDGALRRKGLSRQFEYDGFGRVVRQELSDGTVEIQNCYDGDYSLAHREGIEPAAPHAGNSNGLLTCRRQITSDGGHITEAWYHDGKGRVVESVCKYSGGRVCRNTFSYSFTGKVATKTTVNTASGLSVSTTRTNNFDSSSDLLTSSDLNVDINGSIYSKRTAEYGYDMLGRLNSERHGSALQLTEYNLHGWATKLSADKFTEELGYNTGGSAPCFSGNISAVRWRAGTDLFPTQSAMRKYDLAYDKLNRLVQADYTVEGAGFRADNYSETADYDANGNITHLMRFGDVDDEDEPFDDTDDLTMDYDGNRLVNVDDKGETFSLSPNFEKAAMVSGEEYTYDGNGAMTGDTNRGIALVEYDNLGHPRRVQFTSGSATEYVYTADGRKLRTVHTTAVPYVRVAMGQAMELDSSMVLSRNVVDYWDGGIIVRNDTLSALLFDGGYADIKAAGDSCSLKWHYYVKDHLGSVRVVQGEEGTVEQVNHYYPYGNTFGPYNGNDVNPTLQQYKFNGKELDPVHGLDLYDYGARMYDPLTGRWTSVDPMAEKYYHLSPYAFCHNNAVNAVDPDGKDDFFDENGRFVSHVDTGDNIMMMTCNNEPVNITNIDFNNRHEALANIGRYYLSKVDNDFTLKIQHTGGDNPLSAGMANITGTGRYFMFIGQDGKVNGEYGVASNLINSFYHETRHRYDRSTWDEAIGEVNAVLLQTTHPSWNKVTDTFAHSQASYAASQLNKALNDKPYEISVAGYINKLNKVFLGLSTFSIENNRVTVSNNLEEIIIHGTRKQ